MLKLAAVVKKHDMSESSIQRRNPLDNARVVAARELQDEADACGDERGSTCSIKSQRQQLAKVVSKFNMNLGIVPKASLPAVLKWWISAPHRR